MAGNSVRNGGNVRFILVDDHEFIRLGVKVLLQRHRGWQIIGEASRREAIDTCANLDADVIVLDVRMPEGVEMIQRLHSMCPQASLVMLSVHSDEQSVQAAIAAGARAYVLKTDDARELVAAIAAIKTGGYYFSPSISDLIIRNYAQRAVSVEESKPEELSMREREVLQLLANGKSTKEIASTLQISARTVEGHRSHLMKKVGAHTSSELIRYALRSGIVD
jgi:DNA-binding NarL/FixJ family response regulator